MLRLTLLTAVVAIFAVAAPLGAQPQWLGSTPERAFWVEMVRPDFDEDDLGLTGRALLTGDGGFAERTVHQVGGTVGYDFGSVRPMVELRVPLDEGLREVVPYTIGVGVVIRP